MAMPVVLNSFLAPVPRPWGWEEASSPPIRVAGPMRTEGVTGR